MSTPLIKVAAEHVFLPATVNLGGIGHHRWAIQDEHTRGVSAPWVNPDIDYTLILMCAEDMDMRDLICERSKQDFSDFRLQVAARDWTRLVISYLSLLGFTPSDRARLGFQIPSGPTKLDELLARRQAR